MNTLADIIAKINDTQAAMRKIEAAMAQSPSRVSLQLTYESFLKRHGVLEAKFLTYASADQLDVCTYRVFSETDGIYPIFAFGSTLRDFQKWFSAIYDALKTGPKRRARLSADIIAESSFNFAFTYPGSVGVAMTIPSERMLFENDLQRAMGKSAEMLGAESSDQVHQFAQELGVASIRALYAWVDDHVNANLGVDIHWITKDNPVAEITAGIEHMRNLKQAIEETSDTEETAFEARGWLVGADTKKHTFHMVFEEAEEMRGKMSQSIGESYTVELPQQYVAEIRKTTFTNYATDEEKISYFIESLRRA
jgi:hypothetical protein